MCGACTAWAGCSASSCWACSPAPRINPAGGGGLIHGSASFFVKQVVAAVACSAYAFAFTYVMLKVIDRITPVRVGEEAEEGLDEAMHGESAYEDAPLVTGSAAPAL